MGVPVNYNLRNLVQRKGTTIMTAVGIGLTVAVLIMSIAMTMGMSTAFNSTANPNQAIVLRKGTDAELTSTVTNESYQIIRLMEGIARTPAGEPMVSQEGLKVVNLPSVEAPDGMNVTIRGMTPLGIEMRKVKLVAGEWFKPGLREVVVGQSIAQRYPDAELGDEVKFGRGSWKVVGVFSTEGTSADSEIWVDLNQLRGDFEQASGSNSLLVRMESPDKIAPFKEAIANDRRLSSDVISEADYYAGLTKSGMPLQVVSYAVAIIMAIGSAFAATNTMYAAVSRRSKEIGTLRALGFGRWAILRSFMLESVCLALIGGIVGVLIALPLNGFTTGIGNFATFAETAFRLKVGPVAIAAGLAYAVIIGAIGGLWPAWAASRKNIITAMREL